MTYRSHIFDGCETRVDILQEGSTYTASVLLGSKSGDHYFCEVSLSPTPGFDPNSYTLVFVITLVFSSKEPPERILSSERGRSLLPAEERKKAVSIFGLLTEKLLTLAMPDRVEMCAFESNLPDKALEKYHIICDAARKAGYEAGSPDSYGGQVMWMFRREKLKEAI